MKVSSQKSTYIPRALRDWLWAEAVAMGWKPELGHCTDYNKSVNLPAMMRELAKEAAGLEQFGDLVGACLGASRRSDNYWLERAKDYPFTPRRGLTGYSLRTVDRCVYARVDSEGVPVCYLMQKRVPSSNRTYLSRSFSNIPAAMSYRDRVEIAIEQGQDPRLVPLLEEPMVLDN